MGMFKDAQKQGDDAMKQAMSQAGAQGGAGWANQQFARRLGMDLMAGDE